MKKIPLIVVVGPTASGKTSLAVEIAKRYNGEVVSADSMQIYKDMNIATAKPTIDEMQGIPHHLIGFQPVYKKFSVAEYVDLAKNKIIDIYSREKLPILAGGTGMYVDSLVNNIHFSEENDKNQEVRKKLTDEFQKFGAEYMLNKLKSIDIDSASKLHLNDKSRIIRALEIYELTGKTKKAQDDLSMQYDSPYDAFYIGINYKNRDILYDRINKRVDMMIENGLIDEAKMFYNISSDTTSCQAIGYKELTPYFQNSLSLNECIDNLKQSTRHYAKRQLTWFRKNENINWIYPDLYETKHEMYNCIFEKIDDFIKEHDNG